MLVDDVMTTAVTTAPPDATVQAVARLMRDEDTGTVVLVADGAPVGLVTDRDLALAVVAEDGGIEGNAQTCASSPVIAVDQGADVEQAVRVMRRHGIRRVAVLSAGRLTGLVYASDVALATGDAGTLAPLT